MSKTLKRFIPAFIPLFFEVFRHYRRDMNHNGNIRKKDKSTEKLATVEHLMVKMEKRVQENRFTYERIARRIMIWLAINTLALIAILLKLFVFV